jgi:P27 family predicted phage terminase small subunit
MGARGPLPKSAGERALGGNAGKRDPFENARPAPGKKTAPPPCPSALKGEAKKFWGEYVPMLASEGLFSPRDVPCLTMLSQLWAEYQENMRQVEKHGRYYEVRGVVTSRPEYNQAQKQLKQINELLKQFGMHPASRVRLGPAKDEPEKDDRYSKFRRS